MHKSYEQLRDYIFTLEIIDTHEHLPGRESRRPGGADVLSEYMGHYFPCDLVSAGLTPEALAVLRDPSVALAKRWKLAEPYWEAARNTGYGRCLDISAQGLYGFERIDRKTIAPLNEAFQAARAGGKTYREVLKTKSKIRISLNDGIDKDGLDSDRTFFLPSVRFDDFVTAANQGDLRALAARAGVKGIHTLADLENACERAMDDAIARGLCCLKCALAYVRPLRFEKVTSAEAEGELNELFSDTNYPSNEAEWIGRTAKLQDYMMHHICRLADERGLAMQVHTGIQEGNGNRVYHSDPALLTNLFMEYPNIRFDCFHISYPYQQTLAVLAKNFRNVFIDFAWVHIISPTAAVNAMVEYLDSVPANKISGFGGDFLFVDGVYGHQYMARENIARALTMKIHQGVFDLARAKEVAKMLLFDNPVAIFGLKKFLAAKKAKKKVRKAKKA